MAVVMTPTRAVREPRNGINTPVLFATINAVKDAPALAKFRFRATNRWVGGTFSESRVESFDGAGGTHTHQTQFGYGADHPAVLVGEDRGPTPIEFLLHGLAACITAGIGSIAAARGVTLRSVSSQVEGDIDLRGVLGISKDVRNGYERIRIGFDGTTDAWSTYERTRFDLSKPVLELTDAIVSFAQTEAELQALHRAFRSELSREARAIAAWEPLTRSLRLAAAS